MKRTPVLIITLSLVAAGAFVHGATVHRWSMLAPPVSRSEALHDRVLKLGALSQEDVPSELPIKERSRVTCRRYNFSGDVGVVVASITSGPTGAVSTHTPDVCYPGSGYKTIKAPKKETIHLPGGGTATYMMAVYEKKSSTSVDRQRIRWAWSIDGQWDVPAAPRWHVPYLRANELYKLYVVTPEAARDDEKIEGDSAPVRAVVADVFAQYAGVLRESR